VDERKSLRIASVLIFCEEKVGNGSSENSLASDIVDQLLERQNLWSGSVKVLLVVSPQQAIAGTDPRVVDFRPSVNRSVAQSAT
jgi:hypothetical protein